MAMSASAGIPSMSEVTTMIPTFRIEPTARIGGFSVFMDDQKLEYVKSVHVDLDADCVPVVRLEFYAGKVRMKLPNSQMIIVEEKTETTTTTEVEVYEEECEDAGNE